MNLSNFLKFEIDLPHCLMKTLFYFAIVTYSFTEDSGGIYSPRVRMLILDMAP